MVGLLDSVKRGGAHFLCRKITKTTELLDKTHVSSDRQVRGQAGKEGVRERRLGWLKAPL